MPGTAAPGVLTAPPPGAPPTGDPASGGTARIDTASKSTAPESTAPESSAPESSAPESSAPESSALESTAPESTPRIATPRAGEHRGTGTVTVEPATPQDDAAIRALLRRPMAGEVALSLEREPDARLAAAIEGDRHYAFVARERATGRVLGTCSRSVREVWVNGRRRRVGYLSQLRRDPALPQRLRVFADGFAACDATRLADELPYDLTSIVADNVAARRFLERASRRLRRLPTYRPLCELTTLLIPARRRARRPPRRRTDGARPAPARGADAEAPPAVPTDRPSALDRSVSGSAPELEAIVDCLERWGRRHQFAPAWTADELAGERCRDLSPGDFLTRERDDRVVACLARWDQSGFKQTVVRGYDPRLGRWRWAINAVYAALGRPTLPPVGQPIRLVYLSHVAVEGDDPELLVSLVDEARRTTRCDYLVIGLATRHPLLAALTRRFPARALRSRIYLVHRPGAEAAIAKLDDRVPHLEVATL